MKKSSLKEFLDEAEKKGSYVRKMRNVGKKTKQVVFATAHKLLGDK